MNVEYEFSSLQDCQCGSCPVHDGSQCVVQRTDGMKYATCSTDPTPDTVEAIYCSMQKGASGCQDMAVSKICFCPTCSVWRSHGLDTGYFCVNGSAP